MLAVNPEDIKLRPATTKDEVFLKLLYEDARRWELGPIAQGGNEDLYDKVIKQQYESQHSEYFRRYDHAKYAVIQWDGNPIGRIYIDYRDQEVRILDIAILSKFQGKGIASLVLRGVCIDAAFRGLPVRLSVSVMNRAIRLYKSLGFVALSPKSHIQEMEWFHPDPEAILRGQFLPPSQPSTQPN
jgi:ribosomal protein S18 acetylase RimI-like enzyme